MANVQRGAPSRAPFTRSMRKDYTILMPSMMPIHFELVRNIFVQAGYKAELLTNTSHQVVEEGLKYVHNDTCYPALLVIGQMIDALNSGKYDVHRTALVITQTGGGCRASNYIYLLRKALKKAGYGHVPVISASMANLEKNSGLAFTPMLLLKLLAAVIYGDFLMLVSNQVKAYETHRGECQALIAQWVDDLTAQFARCRGVTYGGLRRNLSRIAKAFSDVPVELRPKVKVGVVGEIYVKYAKLANNDLEGFLASQDCEVMVPGVLGFLQYCANNRLEDFRLYGGSRVGYWVSRLMMGFLARIESSMAAALRPYPRFVAPSSFADMKQGVKGIISYGDKMGEGWLLTGEMVELIDKGYGNIVCTQPFGCLPNHICGKGMIHRIRSLFPESNIVAIDYDPGATRVNQENRIKLMLAVAKERLQAASAEADADDAAPPEDRPAAKAGA